MVESMLSDALPLPNPSLFRRFMEGLVTVKWGRIGEKKQERLTENLEIEGRNLVLAGVEKEEEMNTCNELDVVLKALLVAAKSLSNMRILI
ncbi:peptide methionine sulfoxide reductase A1 [Trifolium repens]|nr:peptide methionine sulfoxide reductase A1 [Trifolium repens]